MNWINRVWWTWRIQSLPAIRLDLPQFYGRWTSTNDSSADYSDDIISTWWIEFVEIIHRIGLAMDAWMWPLKDEVQLVVEQPLLFINSEAFQTKANLETMKRFTVDPSLVVTLKWVSIDWMDLHFLLTLRWHFSPRGSVHYNQNDLPALWPWYIRRFACNSAIDPLLALQLNNRMSLLYLRKHLGISLHIL